MNAKFVMILLSMAWSFEGVSGQCGISFQNPSTPNCTAYSQSIVNGMDAALRTWPWQILMNYNGQFSCGGTLIHPQFVVTAAHCTDGRHPASFVIEAGITSRIPQYNQPQAAQSTNVIQVIQHPYYNAQELDYDISILQLGRPFQMTDAVNLACLPDSTDVLADNEGCYITGWGTTHDAFKDQVSQALQEVCLPIMPNYICQSRIRINDYKICIGDYSSYKSACHGDSGGPLVCKRGDIWKLFGVASGAICMPPQPGIPSSYTRVSVFIDWIRYYVPV